MNEKVFTRNELIDILTPILVAYNVKSAVLFGSYCKGTANSNSDIDLLVDSGLKGLKFVDLIESISQSLGNKQVDLFDVAHIIDGSRIEREIKNTGVKIYGR